MSRNPPIVTTIATQGLGSIASIAVTFMIVHKLGPAGQGFWASYKALLDFTITIALCGLPMAFPFLINVRKISEIKILKFSVLYAITLMPVISLALYFLGQSRIVTLASTVPHLELTMICVTALILVLNEMITAISLSTTRTSFFNMIRTAPPITLLMVISLWSMATANSLMLAAAVSAVITLATTVTIWTLTRRPTPGKIETSLNYAELASLSGWNFGVTVFRNAVPMMIFQLLNAKNVSQSSIGCFSIAMLIQGFALTPMNIIGPMLYNSWSASDDVDQLKRSYKRLFRTSIISSTAIVVVLLTFLTTGIDLIPGGDFTEALIPAKILLVMVPIGYWSQLLVNLLLANGKAKYYALASAVRLIATLGMMLCAEITITAAALIIVAGDAVSFVLLTYGVTKQYRWNSRDILTIN